MSLLPVIAVKKPADLAKVSNGRLGPCHLQSVYFAGISHRSIHPLAARAWNALAATCLQATGLVLSASGSPYRDLQAQTDLFLQRYVKGYNPLICTLADQRVVALDRKPLPRSRTSSRMQRAGSGFVRMPCVSVGVGRRSRSLGTSATTRVMRCLRLCSTSRRLWASPPLLLP
jgi:hypothetical protein